MRCASIFGSPAPYSLYTLAHPHTRFQTCLPWFGCKATKRGLNEPSSVVTGMKCSCCWTVSSLNALHTHNKHWSTNADIYTDINKIKHVFYKEIIPRKLFGQHAENRSYWILPRYRIIASRVKFSGRSAKAERKKFSKRINCKKLLTFP